MGGGASYQGRLAQALMHNSNTVPKKHGVNRLPQKGWLACETKLDMCICESHHFSFVTYSTITAGQNNHHVLHNYLRHRVGRAANAVTHVTELAATHLFALMRF